MFSLYANYNSYWKCSFQVTGQLELVCVLLSSFSYKDLILYAKKTQGRKKTVIREDVMNQHFSQITYVTRKTNPLYLGWVGLLLRVDLGETWSSCSLVEVVTRLLVPVSVNLCFALLFKHFYCLFICATFSTTYIEVGIVFLCNTQY